MNRKNKLQSVVRLTVVPLAGVFIIAAMLPSSGCTGGEDLIAGTGGSSGLTATTGGSGTPVGGTGVTTGGMAGSAVAMGGMAGSAVAMGGMSGSAVAMGGMSGSGGSGASGLMEAVMGWQGWRFEMPCKTYPGGAPLDASCTQGDVCWVGNDSVSPHKESKPIVMGGDPAMVYEFEVHARGVIEPKVHANCEILTQEVEQAGIRICKGGADAGSGFNLWSIEIADPPQRYWMNDASGDDHRTNILDGKWKVQARGQTTVTFTFDNKNTGEINNGCPAFRKVAPVVPPFPNFFVGNFFQLDVIEGSVKMLP